MTNVNSNPSDIFTRQPYHFGSLSPQTVHDVNKSQKRLIISGNLPGMKEKVKFVLDRLKINNYDYVNLFGEDVYLVIFSTFDEAKKALKSISDQLKLDKMENISVKFYESKDERNVYVKNLPLQFTENQLFDLFQPYGSIISKKIIKKPANNNSIGFVRYTSKEAAEKAITRINNQHLNLLGSDRVVRCEFSKTSSVLAQTDYQKNIHYYTSNSVPVPRFQNIQSHEAYNISPLYPQNTIYYNSSIDYQLASHFYNMSLSPNNIYYPSYEISNVPPLMSFTGNYPGPFLYMVYPENNQNQNPQQRNL